MYDDILRNFKFNISYCVLVYENLIIIKQYAISVARAMKLAIFYCYSFHSVYIYINSDYIYILIQVYVAMKKQEELLHKDTEENYPSTLLDYVQSFVASLGLV